MLSPGNSIGGKKGAREMRGKSRREGDSDVEKP